MSSNLPGGAERSELLTRDSSGAPAPSRRVASDQGDEWTCSEARELAIPVAGLVRREEDRSMGKASCVATALIVCLAGCAPTGSGPADPSDVETESTELADTGGDESESTGTYDEVEQASVDEGAVDEDTEVEEGAARVGDETAEGEADPPPVKKECPELDEGTCKITVGCAWNTVRKCIEE